VSLKAEPTRRSSSRSEAPCELEKFNCVYCEAGYEVVETCGSSSSGACITGA